MIDTTILGTVILIAFGIFFILFIVTIVSTAKGREEKRKSIMCYSNYTYPTACAGSPAMDIPAFASALPLEYVEFKDKDGKVMNPDGFLHFIVKGESMQFADIHDNYMIFVKEKHDIDFPKVIVLRRETAPKDQVQYKIRRGWQFSNVKDAESVVEKILDSKEFDIIRRLQPYDNDTDMLHDFLHKRLKKYKQEHPFSEEKDNRYFNVIISTTYHTENCPDEKDRGKIRFSIHPTSLLVGEVVKSFSL